MNSIHNNGPDDKLLKDDIEKLGQAYHRLSSEEPPELLDQAVLSSAHRAVEKTDHWLDFGWVHGLTTAVVVVLALSIILTQRQPTELEENGLSPGKELLRASRKDISQSMPAASAPQAGSRAVPMTAGKVADDFEFKKSLQSADPALEEEMQVRAPFESVPAKSTQVEFADEVRLIEAEKVEIDSGKTDSDKLKVERSRQTAEQTQLQAILILKRTGDNKWETELKIFIENYPDYPLPEELMN